MATYTGVQFFRGHGVEAPLLSSYYMTLIIHVFRSGRKWFHIITHLVLVAYFSCWDDRL